MDFISFNKAETNKSNNGTPQTGKPRLQNHSSTPNSACKSNTQRQAFGSPANMPAFGSPAVSFGSPAVLSFGCPAVQTSNVSQMNRTPSPRQYNNQYPPSSFNRGSPRMKMQNQNPRNNHGYHYNNNRDQNSNSPRSQHMNNYSPRHNAPQKFSPYNQHDGSNFKTPHQYSPQSQRGRGFGRKSMSWTYGQTPRFGNCNPGGSLNFEDYYSPSMVEDPWRYLTPIIAQT